MEAHQLVVGNFVATHQDVFLAEMADWVRDGRIKYKEDLWPGLKQAPAAFRAMLEGGNFGKTLVGVGDDPTLDESIKSRRASDDVLGAGVLNGVRVIVEGLADCRITLR